MHSFPDKQTLIRSCILFKGKCFKDTHLLVEIKEIQAAYLHSPYFKQIYQYLSQNKFPNSKLAMKKLEAFIREIHFARLSIVQDLPR